MSDELKTAIEAAGGLRELARRIGAKHQSIIKWHDIPAKHLLAVEKATGIPREELRPDLYTREDTR